MEEFEEHCPHCKKAFHDRTKFDRHTTRFHKNFRCVDCGKASDIFTSLDRFVGHVKRTHNVSMSATYAKNYDQKLELGCDESNMKSRPNQIKCDECGKVLACLSHFMQHKQYKHGKDISYSDAIEFANASTNTATNIKRHDQQIGSPQDSASLADDTLETALHGFDAIPQADGFPTFGSHLHQDHQCRQEITTNVYQNGQMSLYFSGYPDCHSDPGYGLPARPPEGTELFGSDGMDFNEIDFDGMDFDGIDFDGLDFDGMDFDGMGIGDVDLDKSQPYSRLLESGLSKDFNL